MHATSKLLSVFLSVVLVLGLSPAVAVAKDGAISAGRLGTSSGLQVSTQFVNVSNPRVVADSSMKAGQRATWDCVWFGSYPQDEATTSDVPGLASASWDAGGDAWVGGQRYRRISRSDATYSGYWESGAPVYRYFRYSPVKWRVLEVSGGEALLLADRALDSRRYNEEYASATWATSTVRSWLNGYGASSNAYGADYSQKSFEGTAFSGAEWGDVKTASLENADSPYYGTSGGAGTSDKVFLLSLAGVCGDAAPAHGFASGYSTCDEARRSKASDYGNAMGAGRSSSIGYEGNCWWWLLSPGDYSGYAAGVDYDGIVDRDGRVAYVRGTVRPALRISLSSNHLSPAGTVCSDGTVDETAPTGTGGSGQGTDYPKPSDGGNGSKTKSIKMKLGANASGGVSDDGVLKFFPGNYSAKQAMVPVEFSQETGSDGSVTYKLGVGIGKKDLLDKNSTWNQYKANVEAVRKGTMRYDALQAFAAGKVTTGFSSSGFKAMPKLGLMGYGEFKYKDGRLISRAGSVVASANWEAKADWQFATPIGPVYLQLKGGVGAKAKGKADFDEASSTTVYSGTLTLEPSISVEGGYGIANIATIGAQGSAKLPVQVAPPTKGSIEAKAALHLYLVFVVDWTYDLATFKKQLWDTTGGAKAQSLGAQGAGGSYGGTFSEVDRSYAALTSAWTGQASAGGAVAAGGLSAQAESEPGEFAVLQSGVMPNTVPLLASFGGKQVMVFQTNDPSRATLDSSRLMYSVLDGGTWSEPAPVWDTGTLDAYADLREVGGELYVAWQKEKANIAGDVSADAEGVLGAIASSSEICLARFDANSGEFVDAQRVTDNNRLDMMPSIVAGAGGPEVAFVRNTANALDQASGETQVVVASKNSGTWGESVLRTLGSDEGSVSGIAAYSDGGAADVAYATIESVSVGSDEAAGSVRLARTGAELSGEGEAPSALQWAGGKLYWSDAGAVRAYDCSTGEVSLLNEGAAAQAGESGADGEGADADPDAVEAVDDAPAFAVVGDGMRVLSNGSKTSVVWAEADSDAATSAVRSAVLGEDGALSAPVTLCEEGFGIASSGVVLGEDGSYAFAANTFDVQGVHSLSYASLGGAGSLEPLGASAYVGDGGSAAVTYGVENNSERELGGYTVTVRSSGQVVAQESVTTPVEPGAQHVGELEFDLGQDTNAAGLSGQSAEPDFTVEITPAASGDGREAVSFDASVETDESLEALVEAVDDEPSGGSDSDGSGTTGDGTDDTSGTSKAGNASSNGSGSETNGSTQTGNNGSNSSTGGFGKVSDGVDSTNDTGSSGDTLSGNGGSSSGTGAAGDDAGLSIGATAKAKGCTYEVTGASTATFKKAKNAKSVAVPATVKLGGATYKVTKVAAKAFTGSKIRTVKLGKNVSKLAKKAFSKSKVKTLVIQTKKLAKPSSVKGSFKGSKAKKLTVKYGKVGKKRVSKSFTAKNLGAKAVVLRK